MKKIFSLLLVFAMILSLGACGQPTKEELLSNAEKVNYNEISSNTFENIAKSKNMYCGKNLEITGEIQSIGEDHMMFGDLANGGCVKVFLDQGTLETLEKNQQITVVGKTDDKTYTESEIRLGIDVKATIYTMKPAYVVTETFDVTGMMQTYKYKDGYLLQTDSGRYVVYFKDGENLDVLQSSQIYIPIVVTGKILYYSSSGSENIIKDAIIKN